MASVKARPEAWPALRILDNSASLLKALISFMRGFNGCTSLDFRICANPSDLEVGLEKKREKTVVGDALRGMSV